MYHLPRKFSFHTSIQARLEGSFAKDKNEILFSEFGVNYNNEPEQFRKGTSVFKKRVEVRTESGGTAMRTHNHITRRQWITVLVLFFVNLINYMDRLTIAGRNSNS